MIHQLPRNVRHLSINDAWDPESFLYHVVDALPHLMPQLHHIAFYVDATAVPAAGLDHLSHLRFLRSVHLRHDAQDLDHETAAAITKLCALPDMRDIRLELENVGRFEPGALYIVLTTCVALVRSFRLLVYSGGDLDAEVRGAAQEWRRAPNHDLRDLRVSFGSTPFTDPTVAAVVDGMAAMSGLRSVGVGLCLQGCTAAGWASLARLPTATLATSVGIQVEGPLTVEQLGWLLEPSATWGHLDCIRLKFLDCALKRAEIQQLVAGLQRVPWRSTSRLELDLSLNKIDDVAELELVAFLCAAKFKSALVALNDMAGLFCHTLLCRILATYAPHVSVYSDRYLEMND